MTTPDQRTRDLVARIAERRALGWAALLSALAPPTTQTVTSLCDGGTHATIVHATAWLESERDRFDPDLALLDAYGRGACSRPTQDVVAELSAEHTRLFGGHPELVGLSESTYCSGSDPATEITLFMNTQGLTASRPDVAPDHLLTELAVAADLADRERESWASGSFEQAKELRAVQAEFLLAHPARFVPALCDRLADTARLDFYRSWAGLLRSYLSVEAGVDYGRTVLSETFSPRT